MKRATCSRVVVDENDSSKPTGSPDGYFTGKKPALHSTFTKYIPNTFQEESETPKSDHQGLVGDDGSGDDVRDLALDRQRRQLPNSAVLLYRTDHLGSALLAVLCGSALSVRARIPVRRR